MSDRYKIESQYIDMSYGFPVILKDVSMRNVRGVWVLDVNHHELTRSIFTELSFKKNRLTGHEVRAIRLYFEMTTPEFGQRFNVSHVAVLKWESQGDGFTKMRWPQEKDIRQQVIHKLGGDMRRVYEELKSPADGEPSPISLVMNAKKKMLPRLQKQLPKARYFRSTSKNQFLRAFLNKKSHEKQMV